MHVCKIWLKQKIHVSKTLLLNSATHADCGGEDGILRLFNETSLMEGQVQFCFNSMWTPVCGDNWGDNEASVVCRQLGFSREGMVYTVISLSNH